jgi:hypothetical protein
VWVFLVRARGLLPNPKVFTDWNSASDDLTAAYLKMAWLAFMASTCENANERAWIKENGQTLGGGYFA